MVQLLNGVQYFVLFFLQCCGEKKKKQLKVFFYYIFFPEAFVPSTSRWSGLHLHLLLVIDNITKVQYHTWALFLQTNFQTLTLPLIFSCTDGRSFIQMWAELSAMCPDSLKLTDGANILYAPCILTPRCFIMQPYSFATFLLQEISLWQRRCSCILIKRSTTLGVRVSRCETFIQLHFLWMQTCAGPGGKWSHNSLCRALSRSRLKEIYYAL